MSDEYPIDKMGAKEWKDVAYVLGFVVLLSWLCILELTLRTPTDALDRCCLDGFCVELKGSN